MISLKILLKFKTRFSGLIMISSFSKLGLLSEPDNLSLYRRSRHFTCPLFLSISKAVKATCSVLPFPFSDSIGCPHRLFIHFYPTTFFSFRHLSLDGNCAANNC
jgi:hypothetical protein